jgi:hypothetical protein
VFPSTQPGGGGPALRRQLRILRDFVSGFDLIRMRPEPFIIQSGVPESGSARALGEPGKAYAIYLRRAVSGGSFWARWTGSSPLGIDLPSGTWQAEWIDPVMGQALKRESFQHSGGTWHLAQPSWRHDVALKIKRQ